ncbi:hypothetical protein [Colwellia asteriadis]|uniref:hypothetical protein n=1 Tax=Colwellia asteriadis TaxID=517723 RepID=UPI0031D0FBAB
MKSIFRKIITNYLFFSGLLAHLVVFGVLLTQPYLIAKVTKKISQEYYSWQKSKDYKALTNGRMQSVADEIDSVLHAWKPQPADQHLTQPFSVNGTEYSDLTSAVSALQHGDELLIAPGTYHTPLVITKHDITITGLGHVIFQKGIAQGKGFILSKGNNLTVNNIECHSISNRDGNGACIRQEGVNLTLKHIFFHGSQEGVLETAKQAGFIKIYQSRFERLGYNGQAHGIYSNKASVYIEESVFVATKSQGHAIKVRGESLVVNASVIASLSADDSRLIDMPNGGELMVKNSLLAQGPNSVNGQVIGYGLEGISHLRNSILMTDNVVYLERLGVNYLLALPKESQAIELTQNKNIVIGKDSSSYVSDSNTYFNDRSELGLPAFPSLPNSFCEQWHYCPIK